MQSISLNYLSTANSGEACATNGIQVFVLDGGVTFTALSHQPNNSDVSPGLSGCVVSGSNMFVWALPPQPNHALIGIQSYNFQAGTWTQIAGLSGAAGMAIASKATTLALTTAGIVNHLNVYAGYIGGTTSGAFNGCPVNACPNSVTHTITLQTKFPHGMFGAQGKQTLLPTTNANTQSFDVSPTCDPIFGDPSDPECVPAISGLAHCDFSGATLDTPGTPPNWPQFRYLHSWDDYVTVRGYPGSMPGSWGATATCGASINSCQIPTTSVCADYISPFETFDVEIGGPGATQLGAESLAEAQCSYGDPHENRAWEVIGVYNPADPGGPGSCVPTRVLLSAANTPCQ